jgi:hypothetical protein
MRKWIAIRASAVLALAGSAAALVFSAAIAAVLLFPPKTNVQTLPPNLVRAFGFVMAALFAGAAVWGICTGVGVFRRRNWARISMLVFGGLLAFFGGTGALTMLLMPFPANAGVDQRILSIARIAIVGFYLLMTAVGAWWLILFNRQPAKQYFAEGGAVVESARPLSIGVIGWYLLVSAVGTAACGAFRIPAIVFGFVISGWTSLIVCSALTAVQLYLGAGLLQLNERARVWTIAYLSAIAASGIVTAVTPGFPARMHAFNIALQKTFHLQNGAGVSIAAMPNGAWLALISVAYAAILVWLLMRRREAFRS